MQAVMSLSLECALSLGSSVSGAARRTWVVNSVMPSLTVAGSGSLCSAMITTVAGPTVTRGSWYGVRLTPRVTMSRTCTPSVMSLARSVAETASVSSRRLRPMSSMIALAPSKRRSRWRSRNAGCPARTRSPSQTPSPRMNPESNTDTTARSRGTSSPLTEMRLRSLRGSSSKSCVPWAIGETLCRGQLDDVDAERRADQGGLVRAHEPAAQEHEGRGAEERGDRQLEQAVGEDRGRGLGEIDAVKGEDADQRSLRAADAARQRHEVAELSDQVSEHQRAEGGDGSDGGKSASECRDVERHVGERADHDLQAVAAQQEDRLLHAVGRRTDGRPEGVGGLPAPALPLGARGPASDQPKQLRAQADDQRTECG